MKFVAAKTADQLDLQVQHRVRERLAWGHILAVNHSITQVTATVRDRLLVTFSGSNSVSKLYRVRDPDGWRYSTSVFDQTPFLPPDKFDEPEIRKESEVVNSWEAALRLTDRIPGTDSTRSQFIPSFASAFGLPYKTGSAAIEDQRRIGSLNVGASYAHRACYEVG
jgi:hypothetical protein